MLLFFSADCRYSLFRLIFDADAGCLRFSRFRRFDASLAFIFFLYLYLFSFFHADI